MTPTIKTLTAVAALTLAAGGAMAQDRQTVPLAQPDAAAVTAPETGTTFVVNPDGTTQTLTAGEPAAADEAATDEAAEATDEAAAETTEAETTEAAADEPAADEAATDEAAATEEAASAEAAAPEAADEAAAEEAPADEATEAETADAATEEGTADEATEAEATTEEAPAEEAEATDAEATDEAAAEEAGDEAAEEAHGDEAHAEGEGEEAHADAGSHDSHITDVAFSFEGPFGTYDQHQLQRGLQVYTEICAACHGLRYVPIRTLSDETGPGIPEDQVRAYAAEFTKIDPETEEEVPREPSDNFPYIPHKDGMGPDLSLMAKARAGFHGPYGTGISQLMNGIGGPEYIYSVLTGYTGETKEEAGTTFYGNTAFPGGWIAMPPPLSDDSVEFQDGHPADLASLSEEVSAFLMWTAEPKMMQRKQMGLVAVTFLLVLTILLYLTNKKLWTPHKHPRKDS